MDEWAVTAVLAPEIVTLPGAALLAVGADEDDPPQPIITSENAVRAEMPSAFRSFGLGLLIEPPREESRPYGQI